MTDRSTVGSMAEGAAQRAGDAASATADWARSASNQAAEQTTRAAQAGYEQSQRLVDWLSDCVEERPVASLLAAFGLGFVAAHLLRSR